MPAEEQLRANGEGHPGGLAVTGAVHEALSGRQIVEVTMHTRRAPAAA